VRRPRAALAALAVLAVVACNPDDVVHHVGWFATMRHQRSFKPYSRNLAPVPGTVPVTGASPAADRKSADRLTNPRTRTSESLNRGKFAYETYCLVCHGETGKGDGPIASGPPGGFFPAVRSLVTDQLAKQSDGYIYGVIVNAQASKPVWKGFITPYIAGTGTPDATGVVEVRCIEPLPHTVTKLKSVYSKLTKKVTITGVLMAGGKPRPNVHVRIEAGTTLNPDALKQWAVATTNAAGAFSIVKLLPKTLYAFAYVNPYFNLTCQTGPSTAAKGCVREDTSGEFGPIFLLKPKK